MKLDFPNLYKALISFAAVKSVSPYPYRSLARVTADITDSPNLYGLAIRFEAIKTDFPNIYR